MHIKPFVIRLVILLNLIVASAMAQVPAASNIGTLISKISAYEKAMPGEKVFMQFDKPYYSTGDTLWFKGYLMNDGLGYSPLSNRLYVELLNDSNAVMKRFVFPVGLGLTWGSIPLTASYVHDGTYTIRAYTNWMRNFGDEYFFKQSFYINNQDNNTWLVNVKPTLASAGSKDNVRLALKFTSLDDKSAGLRDLQFKVTNGKKVLLRNTAQTATDGSMNVDFTLPAQTNLKNLNITALDKLDKTRSALIPIAVNRPQDVDIQFMPESGNLVTGIPSHVGFKAIGEDGKGVAIQGTVYDNNHTEVANIKTARYGIGAFDITPQPGAIYTADVTLPGGAKKTVALPVSQKTGSVLRVKNAMDKDTMSIAIYNTAEAANGANRYFLVGMSRGVVCYGASLTFNNKYFSAKVSKNLFPTGVAHFVLLNSAQQPINERITFINHDDNLKIELNTAAQNYTARDSIKVNLAVKDESGKPVVGSFSMAVTDDSQVKAESASDDNIVSHLFLSADLKGYVEDPSYYFEHNDQSWTALDALLLTQGWVGYDLKKIYQPVKPAFDAETEMMVKGTITNLFNKPMSNANVMLLAKGDQNFFKDTVTNKDGRFVFNKFPFVNKTTFIISARNARGKVINGGISVDEKNLAPVTTGSVTPLTPWNVNTDTTVLNYVKTNKNYHVNLDKAQYGASYNSHLLREVAIRDRAAVRNSQNLNGAGESDQTLNEETMVNAGRVSLLDVINSKIKNFHSSFHKDSAKNMNMEYFIRDKRVRFVFDGVDLDRFYEPFGGMPNEHYEYQKQYLDYISAEDILGVEVIYSNNGRYNARNLDNVDDLLAATPTGPRGSDYAYLEITTRAGNGPFIQRATGIYLYKPLPLAEYKEFYKPQYPVKDKLRNLADLRSTIHWQPNIITNREGNSTLTFFAADKPTHYTIIVEGADMNGRIGYQTKKITIGALTQ